MNTKYHKYEAVIHIPSGVRGQVYTQFTDAPYVLVITYPQDVNSCYGFKWQRWENKDIKLIY